MTVPIVVVRWGIDMKNACGHRWIKRSGFGTDDQGRPLCDPCANRREIHAFTSPETRVYVAYVSSGPVMRLTTWLGATLGHALYHNVSRSGFGRSEIHTWRFTDIAGREWYGRNAGPGMVITIRLAGDM